MQNPTGVGVKHEGAFLEHVEERRSRKSVSAISELDWLWGDDNPH
jgi:hypothetical protein